MTAVEVDRLRPQDDEIEVVAEATPTRPPRRRRLRVLAAALLVATSGSALGAFHAAAVDSPQPSRHEIPMGDARWVAASGAATTAWYGTSVTLPQNAFTATLWLQADQSFQVYVNGRRGPTDAAEVRASGPPSLHAVDLVTGMRVGANGLVVAVTNTDGGRPALIARLEVVLRDGSRVESATGQSTWRTTDDAAQVGAQVPASRSGSPGQEQLLPTAPGPSWPQAPTVDGHPTAGSPIPAWPMDAPVTAPLITGPAASQGVVLSTGLSLPDDPTTAWLRVAATGSFDLVVDGHAVGTVVPPPLRDATRSRLYLFDVARLLTRGDNTVVVRVHGLNAAAAIDGQVVTAAGTTTLASGGGWTVGTGDHRTAALVAGTAQETWPRGLIRVLPADADLTPTSSPAQMVLGAVLLLVLWSALTWLTTRLGRRPASDVAAASLAVATAPALAVTLLLASLATWTTRSTAFPLSPGGWWLCVVTLVVALVATAVVLVRSAPWAMRRDGDARLDDATDEPGSSAPSRRLLRRWAWSTWAILLIAASVTAVQAYGLGHDPLWQDETTSLVVADSIRSHGLPQLPSGLYYFKGELYHLLLAGATYVTDDVSMLRAISLVWFFATVLAFGLMLMPVLAPGRRLVHVVAVLMFACAPAELVWATQIRMYQQVQFFAVVFFALFVSALLKGGRARVIGSAVALLAMYLSHEESFVLLPAVPVLMVLQWRTGWWRTKVWWLTYGVVGALIAAQFTLTKIHPPTFGEDLSNLSYVGWDPQQSTFYYNQVFFSPLGTASLAVVSTLAVLAIVMGLLRRDRPRILIGVALVLSVLAVSLVFTAKVERYTFVMLPLLFALSVLGGADLMGWLRVLPGRRMAHTALIGTLVGVTGALAVAVVLVSMAQSPRDYSLLAARATGTTTSMRYIDYSVASGFVTTNRRPGDVVITLAPPNLPARYLGQTPDAIIQTGRNKMLYLIENGGRATDTIFGAPVILDGGDLAAFLAQHRRVWLISDRGSYLQSVPPDLRAEVLRSFTLVDSGAGSTAWLWSS